METTPFAYRFLRRSDPAYWQVTDPDRVWQVVRDDATDNVENPDFKFGNGVSLLAGATVALSMLGLA